MPKRKRPKEEFIDDLRPLKRRFTPTNERKIEGEEELSSLGGNSRPRFSVAKACVIILKKNIGESLLCDEIFDRLRKCVKSGEFTLKSSIKIDKIKSSTVSSNIGESILRGRIFFGKYVLQRKTISEEKLQERRKRKPKVNLNFPPKYEYYVKEMKPSQRRFTKSEACVYVLKKSKEESLICRELLEEVRKIEKSGEITLKKKKKDVSSLNSSIFNSVRRGSEYFGKYQIKRRKITQKSKNRVKRKYGEKFNKFHIYKTKYEFYLETTKNYEEDSDILVRAPPSPPSQPLNNASSQENENPPLKRTTSGRRRRRRKKRNKKKIKKDSEEIEVKKEPTEEEQEEEEEFDDTSSIKIKKEEYDEDEDDDEAEDEARRRGYLSQPLPFFDDEEE